MDAQPNFRLNEASAYQGLQFSEVSHENVVMVY
ncbi:hypothetical protein OCA8868_02373 [Octadecabacter ascidiaceicola]|uniref:Uncharacterized protein n=1 Tax=Octadecabacter ascidiaceicola TaxID=1655543 RepID=A0A238KC47_9RHOB|nr:hypothetical protein OCA8868_02373 [Octadecabacter ascidiaceicola]